MAMDGGGTSRCWLCQTQEEGLEGALVIPLMLQLRRWLDTMARVGAGWRDAFVFFKHEEASTRRASAFQALILHTSSWPYCPPRVRVQRRTGEGARNFGRE
jgi:hypothetical protein